MQTMVPQAAKLSFALAAASLIGLVVFGVGSSWDPLGVVVLAALAAVFIFQGVSWVVYREVDVPVTVGATAPTADIDAGTALPSPSAWPLLFAFGGAVTAIGLVSEPVVFLAGLILLGLAGIEWMVQAWSDRISADPEFNRLARNRILRPIEVPVVAVLIVAFVTLGFSRILLAVPKLASVAVFGGVAGIVLIVGIAVAQAPKVRREAVAVLLVIGGVVLLAASLVAGTIGERDFEHQQEHGFEGTQNVSDRAEATFRIELSLDGSSITPDEIEVPKADTLNILFVNPDSREANLVIKGAGPNGEDIGTLLRPGPFQQNLTFRIDNPGEYEMVVNDEDPIARGVVIVTGGSGVEAPAGAVDVGS